MPTTVTQLIVGRCDSLVGREGAYDCCGSVTLVKAGIDVILVDCGGPSDKEELVEALEKLDIMPSYITDVICTHGHTDHIGNLNLFPEARIILDKDLSMGSTYRGIEFKLDIMPSYITHVICTHGHTDHIGNLNLFPEARIILDKDLSMGSTYRGIEFKDDNHGARSYKLRSDVVIRSLPGHTSHDLSVFVSDCNPNQPYGAESEPSPLGTVVISGDIYECENDTDIWKENSWNVEMQEKSREEILKVAHWIIPGHGPMFRNEKLEFSN